MRDLLYEIWPPSLPEAFISFDLETTGLKYYKHEIIEIGAILVKRGESVKSLYRALVLPKGPIGPKIRAMTGLNRDILRRNGVDLNTALNGLRTFVGDHPIVAYNAGFDIKFLHAGFEAIGQPMLNNDFYCALKAVRRAWPYMSSYRLTDVSARAGLDVSDSHTALGDCMRAAILFRGAGHTSGSLTRERVERKLWRPAAYRAPDAADSSRC